MIPRPAFLLPLTLLPLLLPLGGCTPESVMGAGVVASGATLVFTGKTPLDHAAGWVSGQDCSSVRWERHGPWCAPARQPPPADPYCTRSLGAVDCWTARPPGAPLRGVVDRGG